MKINITVQYRLVLSCILSEFSGFKNEKIGIVMYNQVLLYTSRVNVGMFFTASYPDVKCIFLQWKGTSRQRSGKGAIRKRFHSKNRGGKKPNKQSGTYTMKHIVSRMSSYFPNRWPLSYLN